jgi:hypothetical protein
MKHFLTFVSGFLLILILMPALSRADLARKLRGMIGLDQARLAAGHSIELSKLLGTMKDGFSEPTPWHVWSYTSQKLDRFIIFAGQHIMKIPGESSARVVLLSETGKIISRSTFSTGWRIDISAARFTFDGTLQAHLIDITTHPVINGQDIRRQVFAVDGDRLLFVRMEDGAGRLIRNHYLSPNWTLGGELPAKSVADWLALLKSPELPRRLAAMTYLAGTHMDPNRPREDVYSETVADAKMALAFRDHPETRALLEQYRGEKHPWISQSAALALSPSTDE